MTELDQLQDENRRLRAERDEARAEVAQWKRAKAEGISIPVDAVLAAQLAEARAQLAELQARKCGRFIWKDTAGQHFCTAPLGHSGDCGEIIELR